VCGEPAVPQALDARTSGAIIHDARSIGSSPRVR
jgi:hypothetical protein